MDSRCPSLPATLEPKIMNSRRNTELPVFLCGLSFLLFNKPRSPPLKNAKMRRHCLCSNLIAAASTNHETPQTRGSSPEKDESGTGAQRLARSEEHTSELQS